MIIGCIVLAGGRSSRMGQDKAQVRIPTPGTSEPPEHAPRMVDICLQQARLALGEKAPIVLVSPREFPLPSGVIRTTETPAYGGPVAGIEAGFRALQDGWAKQLGTRYPRGHVGVIAVDAPHSGRLLQKLSTALAGPRTQESASSAATPAVAISVGTQGRRQPLCAVWRAEALCCALNSLTVTRDQAVRALLEAVGEESIREVASDGSDADYDNPSELPELAARLVQEGHWEH